MRLLQATVVLFLLSVPVSGCLDFALEDAPDPGDLRYHFGSGGRLREDPTGGAPVPLDWGWPEYTAGSPPPSWTGPVVGEPYRVTSAVLTVTYDLALVQSTEHPFLGYDREQFAAWFGTSSSIVAHGLAPGPESAGQDQLTVTFEFQLPAGGLYVPTTQKLRVDVASYYAVAPGGHVALVPAETYIDMVIADSDLRIAFDDEITSSQEILVGGECQSPSTFPELDDALAESAQSSATVQIDGSHRYVAAFVAPGRDYPLDVDIFVYGPDGSLIGAGVSPGHTEVVAFGPEQVDLIGTGTWTVVAIACSAQVSGVALGFGTVAV